MHKKLYAPLFAALLLTGCVVAPADSDYGVVVAPALPVIVEFDVDPFYFHGGYYYYYDHHRRWVYSHSRTGPWRELPRDRYPRDVRYRYRDGRYGDRDGWHRDRYGRDWDRDDRDWDRDDRDRYRDDRDRYRDRR